MSANTNATAILTLLNGALPAEVRAYEIDQVPSPRPTEYVDISLARRFGGERRASSQLGITGYRVTIRATSETAPANVRQTIATCRAALEYARLSVGGEVSTPVQFETEDPAGADDGWFSGVDAYTFTIRD